MNVNTGDTVELTHHLKSDPDFGEATDRFKVGEISRNGAAVEVEVTSLEGEIRNTWTLTFYPDLPFDTEMENRRNGTVWVVTDGKAVN